MIWETSRLNANPSRERTVIDGLDLHIRPGEKIGLVGRSGAGKTTVALARLVQLARTRDGGARVLLLTGAGRGFCAGQDLADRNVSADAAPVDLGFTIETYYRPLILSLRALEMPVICAVNGVAAGAGATICSPCSRRMASTRQRIRNWRTRSASTRRRR